MSAPATLSYSFSKPLPLAKETPSSMLKGTGKAAGSSPEWHTGTTGMPRNQTAPASKFTQGRPTESRLQRTI